MQEKKRRKKKKKKKEERKEMRGDKVGYRVAQIQWKAIHYNINARSIVHWGPPK